MGREGLVKVVVCLSRLMDYNFCCILNLGTEKKCSGS